MDIRYLLNHLWGFFLVLARANSEALMLSEIFPPIGATIHTYTFNLTHTFNNSAGFFKSSFLINGMSPGPLIEGDEGDWITVEVNNYLPVPTTIHFHGILQRGTPWYDGVPGITQYPIASGDTYIYHFQLKDQYGPAWYHSHYRGYSADGILGPIYIHPSSQRRRPYTLITNNTEELQLFNRIEKSPKFLMVDDAFKYPMDDVIVKMHHYGIDPLCIQSILINGKGRVYCHPESAFDDGSSNLVDSMGCVADLDSNGYADLRESMDHYGLENPGYSRPCTTSATDLFTLCTEEKHWHLINIVNAGAQYTKMFSIDDHEFYIIAIDGVYVIPEKVQQAQIPIGSRITIFLKTDPQEHRNPESPFAIRFAATSCPQHIEGLALLMYGYSQDTEPTNSIDFPLPNGSKVQNLQGKMIIPGRSIEIQQLRPLVDKLKYTGKADHTFNLFLNRTGVIEFSMFENGAKMPQAYEMDKPLYHLIPTASDFVLQNNINQGDVVDIIMNNFRRYNHPIHLHGHLFHLISYSKTEQFRYNTIEELLSQDNSLNPHSPYFDSVLVPPKGHAVIRFIANNPGIWLLHCHNLGHLLGGMGAIIFESLDDIPPVPKSLLDQVHVEMKHLVPISEPLDVSHDSSYIIP